MLCVRQSEKCGSAAPFTSTSWVVLPDHMHAVLTLLPPDDSDCSGRWKAIKIALAKALPKTERRFAVRAARGERSIWRRRFWEPTIRDERDYAAHVDYVHINPVKHGLVSCVMDWPRLLVSPLCGAGCLCP